MNKLEELTPPQTVVIKFTYIIEQDYLVVATP